MKNYLSLIKFSHTVFAMPFALIGFFSGIHALQNSVNEKWGVEILTKTEMNYAAGPLKFILIKFIFVVLCMLFARSAAMAFNRYVDREIDKLNNRTSQREIPKGIITKKNALLFVIINSIGFIVSAAFINKLCLFLSPVALFVILGYSYTKRFTWLCHFILGLGLSLAPIGAYIAVTEKFNIIPILFSCIVLTWVSAFDIIYALQDEEFDKEHHLFSIPAAVGKKKALAISVSIHVITVILLCITGFAGNFGMLYWIGTLFFISMLIYQHILVKPGDISKVNVAFAVTNGIASVIFGLVVILDLFLK